MTPYSPAEIQHDWEFKILRCQYGEFASIDLRQRILDQEAKAGWILVEVFDHARIGLKRPTSAREHDCQLDFDPYRTSVRPSIRGIDSAVLGSILAMLITVVFLAVMIIKNR